MNAPTQEVPNRFDHAEAQPRIYQLWRQGGYFHAEPDPNRPPYAIVIPPPNVTGALHLGHALNNTLQDIMIRSKRMQGHCTLWMPGTDHAGIATQAVVEKRLKEQEGLTRHDLGREKLVERIWKWKNEYETRILGQLQQMGCSCDWERTRFTLDDVCARAVRATFFNLFAKGLIYRGKRLVNWDTFLQTAVSDDEVFHEEVQGHFWHFRYGVRDPRPGEPAHVTIATTRPETMLGDTAVAVHPDPAAALDQAERELQEKLQKAAAKEQPAIQAAIDDIRQRRESMLPLLIQLRDMARAGRKLVLPLVHREIPLIADAWAKPELGSGCVKITPAHDPNDYDVWQRHPEIGLINILNPDGTLNDQAGPYRGLTITRSRQRVVADMEEAGLLERAEERVIDLAHSDRSKTPIEPYLADQWFVRMDRLAQSAMDAVTDERVRIFPTRYAKGYLDWLGEKRDWPVSRQLWWGHQIPIWSQRIDDEAERKRLVARLESLAGRESLVLAVEDELVLVCVREEGDPLESKLVGLGLTREEDVLDTWFSSALWPHSTLGWPECTAELAYWYPTSVLITSRDIITLWVARMVLAGLNNMGEIPFRDVYIHPKILDGYGEGMSKSKGNGVDPLDVIEKFGADALRFGLAFLTTETQDVRMPVQFECPGCQGLIEQTKKNRELPSIECPKCHARFSTQWARTDQEKALPRGPVVSEKFEQARNFGNKLWNAARFVMINLDGFQPAPLDENRLLLEDRWLLSRITTVTQEVTEALDRYHFADAARSLYDFAWEEFCSFYVEMAKPRLQDPATRAATQRVLAAVLDRLLRLLHPIMPFLTEEIWQRLGQIAPRRGFEKLETPAASLMIAPWPVADARRQDRTIEARYSRFQAALGAIREIRSRQNIAPKDEVQFAIRCAPEVVELLRPMEPYFASMAHAHATGWGRDVQAPPTHAEVKLADMEVLVDLSGYIDVAAEIQRNEKERDRLLGQIAGKEKKLADPKFVARAPADVVERERESLTQLKEKLHAAETALRALR